MSLKKDKNLVEINPENVYFTFSRIRPLFSCGRRVEDTISSVEKGDITVESLPPINVLYDDRTNSYFSMNNRRLYVFKKLKERKIIETVPVRIQAVPNTKRMKDKYAPSKCSKVARLMPERQTVTGIESTECLNTPMQAVALSHSSTEADQIGIVTPLLTYEEQQVKWLGENLKSVRTNVESFESAKQRISFQEALITTMDILTPLRTGMLDFLHYYHLTQPIFEHLRSFTGYLKEELKRGRKLEQIYEVVQYVGHIIPRVYLSITVGALYVETVIQSVNNRDGTERKKMDYIRHAIIWDLLEASQGVQHPVKGLMLRYYLVNTLFNIFVKHESENIEEENTIYMEDNLSFLIRNLSDANWLWIRLGNLYSDKKKAKEERLEFAGFVKVNLVYLSKLKGLTKEIYKHKVFPKMLECILKHKDPVSQEYLLEEMINIFPSEFLVETLSQFSNMLKTLSYGVQVDKLIVAVMGKITLYILNKRNLNTTADEEEKVLNNAISAADDLIVCFRTNFNGRLSFESLVEAELSLIKFTMQAYPDSYFERVNALLGNICAYTVSLSELSEHKKASGAVCIRQLLEYTCKNCTDMKALFHMQNFHILFKFLPFTSRRYVCISFLLSALRRRLRLTTAEEVAKMYDLISVLSEDVYDRPKEENEIYVTTDEFEKEQQLVSSVINFVTIDDPLVLAENYSFIRKRLENGGPHRCRITFQSLTFAYIKNIVLQHANLNASTVATIFSVLHDAEGGEKGLLDFISVAEPLQAIPLSLSAAAAADQCGLSDHCYEMYVLAFEIYNEISADRHEQRYLLASIIFSLTTCKQLMEENYLNLVNKVMQYASRFLQKYDQVEYIVLCANLYSLKKALLKDEIIESGVRDCMRRAMKYAAITPLVYRPRALVCILNGYCQLLALKIPGITAKNLNDTIDRIQETNSTVEETDYVVQEEHRNVGTFYRNTIDYIRRIKAEQKGEWDLIHV